MENMYPAATFAVTRDELLGGAPLLGPAEIARGVCRGADRTVSVLAVTPQRMRRIDAWLSPGGFVTHAASPTPTIALLGSVCDRRRAQELIHEVMISLVGPMPHRAAVAPVELAPLTSLSTSTVPSGVDWIVVLSVSTARCIEAPECTVVAGASGLLLGDVEALDRSCHLDPCDPARLRDRSASIIGEASRSVRDLLSGD